MMIKRVSGTTNQGPPLILQHVRTNLSCFLNCKYISTEGKCSANNLTHSKIANTVNCCFFCTVRLNVKYISCHFMPCFLVWFKKDFPQEKTNQCLKILHRQNNSTKACPKFARVCERTNLPCFVHCTFPEYQRKHVQQIRQKEGRILKRKQI